MDPTLIPVVASIVGYTLIVGIGGALFAAVMSSDNDKIKLFGGFAVWFGVCLMLFGSFDALFENMNTAQGIVYERS